MDGMDHPLLRSITTQLEANLWKVCVHCFSFFLIVPHCSVHVRSHLNPPTMLIAVHRRGTNYFVSKLGHLFRKKVGEMFASTLQTPVPSVPRRVSHLAGILR